MVPLSAAGGISAGRKPISRSAGARPGQKDTGRGAAPCRDREPEPVGNYAIWIVFDDLHDTDTLEYLYRLGSEYDDRWAAYLAAMKTEGLSREP